MTEQIELRLLSSAFMPLIKKFYKSHYTGTKPKSSDRIYGLYKYHNLQGIVRYKPIDDHYLLTGMAVDTNLRGEGLGSRLLTLSLTDMRPCSCYCFSLVHLVSLYGSSGFNTIKVEDLPGNLKSLYIRYTKSGKKLIPMQLSR